MATVEAKIIFVIKVDRIPDEIDGTMGPEGDYTEPISGGEQVVYEVFKRVQEVLPENVYAYVQAVSVLEPNKLVM